MWLPAPEVGGDIGNSRSTPLASTLTKTRHETIDQLLRIDKTYAHFHLHAAYILFSVFLGEFTSNRLELGSIHLKLEYFVNLQWIRVAKYCAILAMRGE